MQWKPGSLAQSDESGLEVSHPLSYDIRAIVETCKDRNEPIDAARFAAYLHSDFGYEMSRMVQAWIEISWKAEIRFFDSQAEEGLPVVL